LSIRQYKKPIVNTLSGISIIGAPVGNQILEYDSINNSFKFIDTPSSGASSFAELTGQIENSQIPDDEVTLIKINRDGATDGQVLTWSDANSQYEPQDP